MMSIVVIGTSFVDIKGFPLGDFIPTGRNASRIIHVHGGVARNIAEDVAALGFETVFVTLTDGGGDSRDIIEELRNDGINVDYTKQSQDGLGIWLAIFNEEGDVYANMSKRPNLLPICDILEEKGDEIFSSADSILIEIDMDDDVIKKVYELADKYNKDVYGCITNMTIARHRVDYIKKTKCFVCNKLEASQLFDEKIDSMSAKELEKILPYHLGNFGIHCMVVTLGGDGAVYAYSDGRHGYCPPEKVKPIDTTGAGDAFFAGTAAYLTHGSTLDEALPLASRMAASVICSNENIYRPQKEKNI